MNHEELVKALRCCATMTCKGDECKYMILGCHDCFPKLHNEAAYAIEAAEKRIAELSLDNKMLKNTIDADKGVMLDRIRFLEAQLPKRGEWLQYMPEYGDVWRCSNCHTYVRSPFRTNKMPYDFCPSCGADMRKMEVQE